MAIPVYVKHGISFREGSSSGRFEVTLGPKQSMGKTVEGVTVTGQMPKGVLNMTLTSSQGTYVFDPVTKVCCAAHISIVRYNVLYWTVPSLLHLLS